MQPAMRFTPISHPSEQVRRGLRFFGRVVRVCDPAVYGTAEQAAKKAGAAS